MMPAGQDIAHYRVLREIGRGGQGTVYLAEDLRLRRNVALKVLDADSGMDPNRLGRFRREAAIASKLDHPGICPIYETGDEGGVPWIAMRYVEGETLAHKIAQARSRAAEDRSVMLAVLPERKGRPDTTPAAAANHAASGPATWAEIAGIVGLVEETARALHVAHEQGVVHRDIKPGNIVVTRKGDPVVLDFGVAQHDDSVTTLTTSGGILGTPAYMSPEQLMGENIRVDRRTDVYSLGVTLFECLTLRRPFDAPTRERTYQAIIGKNPPNVREINDAVPPDLRIVIETALEKDRDRRYQTALDFAEDLRRIRAFEPILAKPIGSLLRLKRFVQRNRALAAALAGLFLALVAGLAISLWLLAKSERERAAKQLAIEARSATLADYERLGDLPRLEQLVAEADTLWPATPGNAPALGGWLLRAEDLVARLPEHATVLARLAAEAKPDAGAARFASAADQFKHDTTARLVAGLRALVAPGDLLDRVRARHAFATTVRDATIVAHEAAWAEAIRSIGDEAATPAYRGLRLKPQLGLVPIGRDPRSGLWEFAHLETADRGREPVPVRRPDGKLTVTDATGLVFVLLPGGSFRMGAVPPDDDTRPTDPNVDPDARPEEAPVTEVRLDPFFMSKYEMTQGQWLRMTGVNPSHYHVGAAFGDTVADLLNPVELVSAEDCELWMERLGLHVPTEAQWEYAARGGVPAPRWTGIDPAALEGAANLADQTCRENGGHPSWPFVPWSDGYTIHAPVGSFAPNPFGLHDVLGNVQELCRDRYCDYENPPAAGDGLRSAPGAPDKRMVRGGAFNSGLAEARAAGRNSASAHFRNDSLGLRPARMVVNADP